MKKSDNFLYQKQTNLAYKGNFYVGGRYICENNETYMIGQAYIEVFIPKEILQPYPLVLFHGSALTSVCWHETPDGRKGWVDYYVEQGFVVYTFEQPARGRSVYNSNSQGKLEFYSSELLEKLFTACKEFGDWPQAKKHTQWPGSGLRGDPVFDAFYASTVGFLSDDEETEKLVQGAGVALLEKIGPAILIVHSQAGNFGWLIADRVPALVKGIIALEPIGPPFQNVFLSYEKARPWGLSEIPMSYYPSINNPIELNLKIHKSLDESLCDGIMQEEPIYKLPNLIGIPILILTTESSYHSKYDFWTSKFLEQAGVSNKYLKLDDIGIKGNGHMMMMEKNNLQIAELLRDWITKEVR